MVANCQDVAAPSRTHRVGKFEFEIVAGERTPEVEERWAKRSETITRWLLAEWVREQRRRLAERN